MYVIPKLQAKVNALSKQRVKTVRVLATQIGETVQGASDIHANDSGRFERAKTSGQLGRIFDIREEIYRRKFFIKFLNNFLAQVTPFFFFSIGGYLVIKGEVSLGALVAVLAAYKDIGPPWKELLKFYQVFEDTRVKYFQVAEQFEPKNMIRASLLEVPDTVESLSGDLKVQNVSYGEEEGADTVSSVGFSIPLDSHVAVVGGAGSGKSGVSALAARLIWPTTGQIQMGKLDWADAPEAVTGRRVGWVGSTPYIFSGTIAHNLYYGLFNAPKDDDTKGDSEAERRAREAEASGNSPDDSGADWLDLTAGGFRDDEGLRARAIQVLKVAKLEDDVYQMGLGMRVPDETRVFTRMVARDPDGDSGSIPDGPSPSAPNLPDIKEKILNARRQIRERNLGFKAFDPDAYNANISVAENLLFGHAIDPSFEPAQLSANRQVTDLLHQAGLFDDFLIMGHKVAATMTEIFSGVSPESDLFEQFSLISGDDLVALENVLHRLPDDQLVSLKELPEVDQEALRALVYRLVPARHRLGVIDDEVQGRLLEVRKMLREALGPDNSLVNFLDPEDFNPGLDFQSNILFGAMPYGKPAVRDAISKALDEAIEDVGLRSFVMAVGLTADVGTSGGRLSSIQRQKLGFARALMKNPDLLVVDEALAPFDFNVRGDLIKSIREHMHGRGIFWALESAGSVEHFEDVIVMESGKVLEQGKTEDMIARDGPLKTLLAT